MKDSIGVDLGLAYAINGLYHPVSPTAHYGAASPVNIWVLLLLQPGGAGTPKVLVWHNAGGAYAAGCGVDNIWYSAAGCVGTPYLPSDQQLAVGFGCAYSGAVGVSGIWTTLPDAAPTTQPIASKLTLGSLGWECTNYPSPVQVPLLVEMTRLGNELGYVPPLKFYPQ